MSERVCPVWIGYLLASPLRRLAQNPEELLAPFLRPGMSVLEIGPGMGFFTFTAARMVGETGRIFAVDVQEGMLKVLAKRAHKAGLESRIQPRLCTPDSLGVADLSASVDFILLFAVVHEVPDPEGLFAQLSATARPGCRMLFAEPRGHVKPQAFEASLSLAAQNGFTLVARPAISGCHAAVLTR